MAPWLPRAAWSVYTPGVPDDETISASGPAGPVGEVPRVGQIVAGKYKLERVIGAGGMGFVFAARHLQLGELAAFKFLHPKIASDTQAVERFLREARATSRIKSDHVVRILDASTGEGGAPPYILMEYLEGQDLGHILHDQGKLPIEEAVDYVLQACEGLAEAHQLGIVHRDIKPSNLLLGTLSDGTAHVKILDFGISKALLPDVIESTPNLTDTQAVFGSPAYMSPEQVRSAKKVDHRTDVWALGVVLFELLTRATPFQGETTAGVLAAVAADAPTKLRELRPEAPEELEQVIEQALVKNKDARVQSVVEMARLLEPFASAQGHASAATVARLGARMSSLPASAPAPPSSTGPHVGTTAFGATERSVATTGPGARKRAPFALVVGVAAALGVVILLSAIAFHRSRQPRATASPAETPGEIGRPTEVVEPAPVRLSPNADPATTDPVGSPSSPARRVRAPSHRVAPPGKNPPPPASASAVAPPPAPPKSYDPLDDPSRQ